MLKNMNILKTIILLLILVSCNNIEKKKSFNEHDRLKSITTRWMAFNFKYFKTYEETKDSIINIDSLDIRYRILHIYSFKNANKETKIDTAYFLIDSLYNIKTVDIK
ncbi:MAG: hypothetical protein A2X12_06390 [Bacteroidetes bacterium GWE2_29_8]|nr:MAG: hypothetical protein A2X12_06390 [Bacteroidetes bacterium GWE2_29_8]